tara:strand:+ start:3448 stop:5079 length:1632 start_codon:yes stop_codon:yes gene_type:complete
MINKVINKIEYRLLLHFLTFLFFKNILIKKLKYIYILYTMPSKKLNFSLSPLNDNPVSVSGATLANGFTHKNGFPTIKFSIPAQDILLDTQSLYLCGQYILLDNAGDLVNTTYQNRDTIDANNNLLADNTKVNFSNWNGISSVIDKVVIQSKKTQQEIQTIVNYSQWDALKMGHSNNNEDYRQSPLIRNLCSGTHDGYVKRHLNQMPVIGGGNAEVHIPDIGNKFYGQFFSVRLDVALLKAQMLHLGNAFCGGLLLTLHLQPDAGFFHQRFKNLNQAGNSQAQNITGFQYVLKSLKLEGKYAIPTQEDLASYNPVITLNTRVNLMNDIVSSSNSNTYTPQLQQVKGIVNTFMDDDQQNNYSQNQNNYRVPVGLQEYQQGRNNIRFPYDYPTKLQPNTETTAPSGNAVGIATLAMPQVAIGDSELRLQFVRSMMGGKIPSHTSLSLGNSNENLKNDYGSDTTATGTVSTGDQTHPDLLGIACDYTNGLGQLQNFVNQDYELKVECGVNTGRGTLPNDRKNKVSIQESYIKNFAEIDLRTLQKVQ